MKRPRKPRMVELCAGIGGFSLAAEWAGFEIAGLCEIDPYCQAVLKKHWPSVPLVPDIRHVWGNSYGDRPIDLFAGGIPCQPFSLAGKRAGSDDPRHLWPEVRRIAQIFQPTWLCIENVAGFVSLALDDLLDDLAGMGYEAGAITVPAAAVGAPHLRERVFIVAHADGERRQQESSRAHGDESAHEGRAAQPDHQSSGDGQGAGVAHPTGRRRSGRTRQHSDDDHRPTPRRDESQHDARDGHAPGRREASAAEPRMGGIADGLSRGMDSGLRSDSAPRHPWPAGPAEAQRPWEAPRVSSERIPNRDKRLHALGNAVVPQQCYPILAAIADQWRREHGEHEENA